MTGSARSAFALTAAAVVLGCAVEGPLLAQDGHAGSSTSVVTLSPPAIPRGVDRDNELDVHVGTLVDAFAKKGPFSGIVVVAREGKIVAARVAGSADVEHRMPTQLDTPMRIASVTKMLTAADARGLAGLREGDGDSRATDGV